MRRKNRFRRFWDESRARFAAGAENLRTRGVANTAVKTFRVLFGRHRPSFGQWMRTPLYTPAQLRQQREEVFAKPLLFSILTPLYNTPEDFLRDMIESVLAQTYTGWELCLADGSDAGHAYVGAVCREYAEKDGRIRYLKLDGNYGIAGNTNRCVSMAKGDYLSLLDHDDLLHPAALYDTRKAIDEKDADLVYTDEATFRSPDPDDVFLIHFKPDFAPDNLLANNYICHFTSFRRSLLERCGTFREGYDGAQDHELMLRLTREAGTVAHVPKVLYYWRASGSSTAQSEGNKPYVSEAGIRAVSDYLRENGVAAEVTLARGLPTIYRVTYPVPEPEPKVSIVIANRDHADDLRLCVSSILEKTDYGNYEIVIAENGSREQKTFEYYREIEKSADNVTVVRWPGSGFNWSAINNYAVREKASGDHILLLNNDTEVISGDWIREMAAHASRPEVGAVGAMLYYPDGTIQHAGVIVGLGGAAGHAFHHMDGDGHGYMGRLCYAQDLSAVTGACVMIRRDVWEEVGGLDESFAVNLNDIDLCLRIREKGYLVVWTPYAELYHYESKSRGGNERAENRALYRRESGSFRARWGSLIEAGDPYYNPNLTHRYSDFMPKNRKEEP